MKINIDGNNVVIEIGYTADAGGITPVGDVPDDLYVLKYKYIDGSFVPNPDYEPPQPSDAPAVSQEERLSATEDAVAEIIEMLLGGE